LTNPKIIFSYLFPTKLTCWKYENICLDENISHKSSWVSSGYHLGKNVYSCALPYTWRYTNLVWQKVESCKDNVRPWGLSKLADWNSFGGRWTNE
jgi:hypothetical protein